MRDLGQRPERGGTCEAFKDATPATGITVQFENTTLRHHGESSVGLRWLHCTRDAATGNGFCNGFTQLTADLTGARKAAVLLAGLRNGIQTTSLDR